MRKIGIGGGSAPQNVHTGGMTRLDQLRSIRTELLQAATRHGASDVRVFGSVARGEETAGSDVDFLVTLGGGRSLFDLARLYDEFEGLVGGPIDIVTEGGVHPYLRDRVLSDAVPL